MDENRQIDKAAASSAYKVSGPWDWKLALAKPLELESLIAATIGRQRWFGAKTRSIRAAHILDAFRLGDDARLLLVEIQFAQGASENYQLLLAEAVRPSADRAADVWARIEQPQGVATSLLIDALADDSICTDLLRFVESQTRLAGDHGELCGWRSKQFSAARGDPKDTPAPRLSQAEQSNSSIIFGDRLILKLFRRLEKGLNPDLEINAHLTSQGFAHVPPLAGAIEYRRPEQEPWALAVLQKFVPNQGDAWQYFLGRLEALLRDAAVGAPPVDELVRDRDAGPLAAAGQPLPLAATTAFAPFLADAARLGQRTAEMHLALAAATNNPDFVPQRLSLDDQRAFAERTCALVEETFELLRPRAPSMSGQLGRRAADVLARRQNALDRIVEFASVAVDIHQIRCHGDYHLGQVLVAGEDFVIIDFEGEPARPLAERRGKQLALRDVAGMVRSFHYASCAAAQRVGQTAEAVVTDRINRWAAAWYFWTSVAFLAAYRKTVGNGAFVPPSDEQFGRLLDACLLEKAVYELRYELNNRPDWVYLPLAALADLLR